MLESFLPDPSLKQLAKKLLLAGLFFHLLAAWFNVGYYHPDEYFQVIEFASAKSGITPEKDLAWEYNAAIRPAFQPSIVVGVSNFLHSSNPVFISFVMRLISSVTSFLVTFFFILVSLSQVHSLKIKKAILYLSTLLWFMPVVHAHFSSENWTAIFFFSGLIVLNYVINNNTKKKRPGALFLCGILLGLAYDIRFQTGIMIACLMLWLIVYRAIKFSGIFVILLGIILSVFAGVLIDRWFYDRWVFTAYNYFRINIIEGRTSDFGVMPWWDYFRMIFINIIPPFSIIIIGAVAIFFIRYKRHILTWVCLPFILLHILNGHKELRFLFPLIPALPLITGLAFDGEIKWTWWKRMIKLISQKTESRLFSIFIAANVVLMSIASLKPANENFPVYDFIYSRYNEKQVDLYTATGNPYILVGLPVDFYKPRKLSVIELQNDSVYQQNSAVDKTISLYLEKGYSTVTPSFLSGKKYKLVYQNIPGWLTKFNFNNWLKRANAWQVYEIQ